MPDIGRSVIVDRVQAVVAFVKGDAPDPHRVWIAPDGGAAVVDRHLAGLDDATVRVAVDPLSETFRRWDATPAGDVMRLRWPTAETA